MKRWQRPGDEEDEEFSTHGSSFVFALVFLAQAAARAMAGKARALAATTRAKRRARPGLEEAIHYSATLSASVWLGAPSSRHWEAKSLQEGAARASPKHPKGRCWTQPTSNCKYLIGAVVFCLSSGDCAPCFLPLGSYTGTTKVWAACSMEVAVISHDSLVVLAGARNETSPCARPGREPG